MTNWPSIWSEVENILRSSASRGQALERIAEVRGEPASWDALARAGRRAGVSVHELLAEGAERVRPAVKWDPAPFAGRKHLVIPDTQVRPGVPISHFRAIGRYIVAKRPDVVVHLGDHWDMPSLSAYDSAKSKASRGLVKKTDIGAGNKALEELEEELVKGNFQPKVKILLEGNHDGFSNGGRFDRYFEEHPEDTGLITLGDFADSWLGWTRVPFLEPITIDGVAYCHLFPFNSRGQVSAHATRQGAASPDIQVRAMRRSATAGHKQGLQLGSLMHAPGACAARGIIAGSCYQHDEKYLGPAKYWRGLLVKHNVSEEHNPNHYSLCEVGLGFLLKRYGG